MMNSLAVREMLVSYGNFISAFWISVSVSEERAPPKGKVPFSIAKVSTPKLHISHSKP